jgi:RND family efflux transporter MFP subunit
MDARKRYLETVMTLCNEAAARFRCERVSVGWLEKGDVRIQGISHTEKFEKKMAAIRKLEEVMEEALDQDSDIVVPVPDGADAISRTHESFSKEQGGTNVASFPLRSADGPVGVLTLERADDPFDDAELRSGRMLSDQVVTRLGDLKKHDRWFGARAWVAVREGAAKLVGVENTGWKLVGLVAAVALAVLIFGGSTYRVEAPFILKSDTLAQVPAGFSGYIAEVNYRLGDEVKEGQVLIRLDTRQLLLEEAGALAEEKKHRSEMQRAEAEGELAQMRIAAALADQAAAKLELTRFRLSQGEIKAPFDGVVVEGDLRERIGSPVEQGEVLMKIAKLDEMYVEGKVDERNLDLISSGGGGEIAFASEPENKFGVEIERIEPLAVADEEGNIFIVRCTFPEGVQDWWRPGMSGLCKINTQRRSYLWMLTHKTVDFLRMKLWW